MRTKVIEMGGLLSALSWHGVEKQLSNPSGVYRASVIDAFGSAAVPCDPGDERLIALPVALT